METHVFDRKGKVLPFPINGVPWNAKRVSHIDAWGAKNDDIINPLENMLNPMVMQYQAKCQPGILGSPKTLNGNMTNIDRAVA